MPGSIRYAPVEPVVPKLPGQRAGRAVQLIRETGQHQRNGHDVARVCIAHGRAIDSNEIGGVQVFERHAAAEILIAEIFGFAVHAIVAVEFVDDVVKFGKDETAELFVQAVFVEHVVILPCQIAVASGISYAPDHAAFAVHQRRARLPVSTGVIKLGTGISVFHNAADVIADCFIAVFIKMPGVQVGFDMIVVAGRIILDQTGGIERFRAMIDAAHPFLRFGQIAARSAFCGEQPPRFIEYDPGENAWMVEIAGNHLIQFVFIGIAGLFVRFAPETRHIFHHEDAEPVHPVELARFFRFDVDARHIQPQALEPPCFGADIRLAGISEITLRVKSLIERAVEVDGLSVEQNPLEIASVHPRGADLAHAEIGADLVRFAVVRYADRAFI